MGTQSLSHWTAKEVPISQFLFSRGDELRALGLDVPEIVRIREDLARNGVSLPFSVLTDTQLAEALCPLL